MEEIDIIELLKRVKEGNAPKEIEINGEIYIRDMDYESEVEKLYKGEHEYWLYETGVTFDDTKIKILDKPIIEELPKKEEIPTYMNTAVIGAKKIYSIDELVDKINEIIKWINKENKDE